MPNLLVERKPYLLLLVLLTCNLVLMSSRVRAGGGGNLLEEAVLSVGAPFLRVASWVAGGVHGTWSAYVDLRRTESDNQRLRTEVAHLAAAAHETEELRQEIRRLREILDLRAQAGAPAVASRVIGRIATEGARVLLLDHGSRDGIRLNMPVVTPRGAVGRVIETAPGVSKVQTIRDPNSGVAATLQRTRVQGMVVGAGDAGCRMEYVSELSQVEVGDVVVTSGLDQIYPKGILIGVVAAIGEGEGLTKLIEVRPEVDFARLEEVLVLQVAEEPAAGEPR